jgi:hypothetical protein
MSGLGYCIYCNRVSIRRLSGWEGHVAPIRSTQWCAYLASAHAVISQIELATAELAEARRLSADDRFSSITRLKAAGLTGSGSWGVPQVRELYETTYFVGLRLAGMPEQ